MIRTYTENQKTQSSQYNNEGNKEPKQIMHLIRNINKYCKNFDTVG